MENSQGNWAKPPRSPTTEGTAVAMTVDAMATRPVDSITPMSTGPRSDRKPTPEDRCSLTPPRLVGPRDDHGAGLVGPGLSRQRRRGVGQQLPAAGGPGPHREGEVVDRLPDAVDVQVGGHPADHDRGVAGDGDALHRVVDAVVDVV